LVLALLLLLGSGLDDHLQSKVLILVDRSLAGALLNRNLSRVLQLLPLHCRTTSRHSRVSERVTGSAYGGRAPLSAGCMSAKALLRASIHVFLSSADAAQKVYVCELTDLI
jgi:hypothetical protein